jgi:hypothetical protein
MILQIPDLSEPIFSMMPMAFSFANCFSTALLEMSIFCVKSAAEK